VGEVRIVGLVILGRVVGRHDAWISFFIRSGETAGWSASSIMSPCSRIMGLWFEVRWRSDAFMPNIFRSRTFDLGFRAGDAGFGGSLQGHCRVLR